MFAAQKRRPQLQTKQDHNGCDAISDTRYSLPIPWSNSAGAQQRLGRSLPRPSPPQGPTLEKGTAMRLMKGSLPPSKMLAFLSTLATSPSGPWLTSTPRIVPAKVWDQSQRKRVERQTAAKLGTCPLNRGCVWTNESRQR
mmetsp:Transcript_4076/g.9367  ORF Transcript_4076/g.9367 Transcript_4076/m.9367 type:complete len:140 (-) Transcript_4076:213-632(-)